MILDTEFTTVITVLSSIDSKSSTMKSILIVFHCIFKTERECNSLRGRCQIDFVCIYKSQILIY